MDHPDLPPAPKSVLRVDLTARTALVVLAIAACAWLLLELWEILVVIVVALMLVGMLNPLVERLQQRGMRRGHATGVVFGVLFLLVGGFLAVTLPRLVAQVQELVTHFAESREIMARQLEQSGFTAPLADSVRAIDNRFLPEKAKQYGLSYGPKALEIFAYGVSSLFLSLYLLLDRDRMRGALFAIIPRAYHLRFARVLLNLEIIVGGYMRGQAVTSALMAVFTFVVLIIAGVPNALALALFAGLADVLPYVGALLACGPAVLAALSKGPTVAVTVMLVLMAYQELETRVIVPRVYGRVLRLPAAAVMTALLVGGKLLGILGALLALPIAAGVRMVIEELRVDLPGDDVDDPVTRAKDEADEAQLAARTAGAPAAEAATIATKIAVERREDDVAHAEPEQADESKETFDGD